MEMIWACAEKAKIINNETAVELKFFMFISMVCVLVSDGQIGSREEARLEIEETAWGEIRRPLFSIFAHSRLPHFFSASNCTSCFNSAMLRFKF